MGVFWIQVFNTYQEKYMPPNCIGCWGWGVRDIGMTWLREYSGVKGRGGGGRKAGRLEL